MPSERDIAKGLERAYGAAEVVPLDLTSARCVVLSDQHKGARDGADDFRTCEKAYRAALGYYLADGYTLYALGDVEELWECRAKNVIAAYESVMWLEAEFHKQGRYVRFFGNHDDKWESPRAVATHLHRFYPNLVVIEGLRLELHDASGRLGEVFLVHGHQGSSTSDKFKWISKPIVRYIWRPIQRLTHAKLNTPATSFALRATHGRAMHAWASGKRGTVLIAGHTHKPVFLAEPEVPRLEAKLAAARDGDATAEELAALRAELEWHRSLEEAPGEVSTKPCYFNTGCCVFDDGDCTGIELADGEIRLVRWPDDEGRPRRKVIRAADLRTVFRHCAA